MSREKQIEEMSVLIYTGRCLQKSYVEIAEVLYNAGYRKQSEPISCGHEKGGEWISVDERLPEKLTHVIVHDEDGTIGEAFYLSGDCFEWVANEKMAFVTHWMPLPEAPKGGAE